MKIVILEDYPDRLGETVKQLNDICPEKCEVEVLVYDPQNDYGKKTDELAEMLSCQVTIVDYWHFEEKLDELYENTDTLFLFDTDIDRGAVIEVFKYRINVRYAMKKKAENQPYRIWFYTTVEHLKCAIEREFGDHVIVAGQSGTSLKLNIEECPTFCKALGLQEVV